MSQGHIQPSGFRPEAKDFAAKSPVSLVDKAALVDSLVQDGQPNLNDSGELT